MYQYITETHHTQPRMSQLLRAAHSPVYFLLTFFLHLLFRFVVNLSLVWFYIGSLFIRLCVVNKPFPSVALCDIQVGVSTQMCDTQINSRLPDDAVH